MTKAIDEYLSNFKGAPGEMIDVTTPAGDRVVAVYVRPVGDKTVMESDWQVLSINGLTVGISRKYSIVEDGRDE